MHSLVCYIVPLSKFLRCMHFLKIILLRGELMVNTFDVSRIRVLEYMRTYQEYLRKLPILIRFKEYVDNIFRCIHSANEPVQCPLIASVTLTGIVSSVYV